MYLYALVSNKNGVALLCQFDLQQMFVLLKIVVFSY